MIQLRRAAIVRRLESLRGRAPAPSGVIPWEQFEQLKLLSAEESIQRVRKGPIERLADAELRVFSQFGDDGILQYLTFALGLRRGSFVEFGVQDYTESNTRLLVLHDDWRGLVIDGSGANVDSIRRQSLSWRHDVTALEAFITRDNINDLLRGAGYSGHLDILSVDIDGNDYWVWEAISEVDPVIVVAEYNSLFGSRAAVTVPYDPDFVRQRAHHSHLYWGASLGALTFLAERKGYVLVGSNSNGNNAYFVKRDRAGDLPRPTVAECYVEARFRESRDERGVMTFVGGSRRQEIIGDLVVEDVANGRRVSLRTVLER